MPTIAAHTLGCKVNQYDTQAMMEAFEQRGYQPVSFDSEADVYLINTCTVTGTGDHKSMQLLRRVLREHPASRVILCGCLAQREGAALASSGACLILGTARRAQVVDLYESAAASGTCLVAVEPLDDAGYEPLQVHAQLERTRAVMKIQEGCRNHCTYCIIPSVRGPVRSRPLEDIAREARELTSAGYRELVLTGIHLASYGLDFGDGTTLLSAIRVLQDTPDVWRIRLGSLEPGIATAEFARSLGDIPAICPQFHLALQSGSDSVLRAMHRRYTRAMYLQAVDNLRSVFPHCALTTDIMTGFPGETDEDFAQSVELVHRVGFARIHVFPYSEREHTPAATLPGAVPRSLRESRARTLIQEGRRAAQAYHESMIGSDAEVLVETCDGNTAEGYSREYIRVRIPGVRCLPGEQIRVRLCSLQGDVMEGRPV